MQNEQEGFNKRQPFRECGVEEDRKGGDGDDEKGGVPGFWDVVLVIEDDQALNHGAAEEADGADGTLPAGETEPAHDVGPRKPLVSSVISARAEC